jgi:hypothetical protein
MANVVETSPVGDPPGRSEERLDNDSHEERLAVLFRRWPALADHEAMELRRLWEERIREAKRRRSHVMRPTGIEPATSGYGGRSGGHDPRRRRATIAVNRAKSSGSRKT